MTLSRFRAAAAFTMSSHPRIPQRLSATAQKLLAFDSFRSVLTTQLYSTNDNDTKSYTPPSAFERSLLIQSQLSQLNIDSTALHDAAMQSIQNPIQGYNNEYGKPAIRCYRSFIYPKSIEGGGATDSVQQTAAALRCARQVEFLIKRHKSAQSDLIRHVDTATERTLYPLIVVLDNVRSALNVGSLFRTADATGCTLIITVGITPHPLGSGADKLAKSALGAEYCVPSQHFERWMDVLGFLQSSYPDYALIGMETTNISQDYTKVDYPVGGVVLFLGNEVTGVDTDMLPLLDKVVEIPMFGLKNSLNIAACAPVVLYEILRQWNTKNRTQ